MQTESLSAVIYSRVSSDDQAGADKTSLDKQEDKGRKYAELAGWEIVGTFREDFTGDSDFGQRPEGARVLDLIERGEVQAVVFFSIDRIARKAVHALNTFDYLEGLGVVVAVSDQMIDTSTPSGAMMRTMLAGMAEFERATILARTQSGKYLAAKKHGTWPGAPTPYGLKLTEDRKALVIDETEAPAVRRAFEMRAAGASSTAIVEALAEAGYKARPKDRKIDGERVTMRATLNRSVILAWFRSEFYKGEPVSKKLKPGKGEEAETFTFETEAIVDADLWQAANEVKKVVGQRPKKAERRLYSLSGRAVHSHEDGSTHSMQGIPDRDKRLYGCSAGRRDSQTGKMIGCPGFGEIQRQHVTTRVSADRLEARFLDWALDKLDQPEELRAYVADADRKLAALAPDETAETLAARRLDLEGKLSRLTELYTEGDIEKTDYTKRKAEIEAKIAVIDKTREDAKTVALTRAQFAKGIEALLSAPIAEAGNSDPDDDGGRHVPTRGSDEWRQKITEDIHTTLKQTGPYERVIPLPDWVVEEAAFLAEVFGARFILETATEADLPSYDPNGRPANWPRLRIGFDARSIERASKQFVSQERPA